MDDLLEEHPQKGKRRFYHVLKAENGNYSLCLMSREDEKVFLGRTQCLCVESLYDFMESHIAKEYAYLTKSIVMEAEIHSPVILSIEGFYLDGWIIKHRDSSLLKEAKASTNLVLSTPPENVE